MLRRVVVLFFVIATLAALFFVFAPPAYADQVRGLNMTFQSGAVFTGNVSFTDDFTSVTGVNGTLYGYQYGSYGYTGTGSDLISWVWFPGTNFSGDPVFGTFLMDGTSFTDYYNFISFTYNYNAAPNLIFANVAYGNGVDYVDPMVDGSINPVPEPSTLSLLVAGALGWIARRKVI